MDISYDDKGVLQTVLLSAFFGKRQLEDKGKMGKIVDSFLVMMCGTRANTCVTSSYDGKETSVGVRSGMEAVNQTVEA